MALHLFCIECGTKIPYSLKKPNFCPECGYNFVTGQIKKEASPVQKESEVSQTNLPSKLEFAVEGLATLYKLEDLAKEEKLGTSRGTGDSKTGKELLQEIREECSPSKGTVIE